MNSLALYFISTRRATRPTLFPYTTLFRSIGGVVGADGGRGGPPRQVHAVDVSMAPRCQNIEVCAVVSEHGTYAFAGRVEGDRKSTRLNFSHPSISYAVFSLK